MNKVSLDLETRSGEDLTVVDTYRYAAHPEAQVLILAVKQWPLNDGKPVLTWDVRQPTEGNEALLLLWEAIEFNWEIHAFNSTFEWCFLKYVCPRQFGLPIPDINNIRCTQALCRSAGLQSSLEKCADFLKVPFPKDKMGKPLMRKFSIPDKAGNFVDWDDDVEFTAGGQRMTAAEGFEKYVAYCAQDVRSEMAVAEAMKPFELKGEPLQNFLATARLNDRGVPVDRVALENARKLYTEHEVNLTGRYRDITGHNPGQNKVALEWFQAEGYGGDSMNKATRARYATSNKLSDKAKAALQVKGELAFAAIKKIPAMLNRIMEDDRIRGSFMWCGAQKTWRWTSKGVQYQNMKKPSKALRPVIEEAYQDVRNGMDLEMFGLTYGDPYEVIASLARYFVRFPDTSLLDLDYSSVEAVILPTLIGADRILEKFERGEDIYVETGAHLSDYLKTKYDVPFEIDRDTAKTVVLATQFQGGWHAVFTSTGNKWERKWCEAAAAIVRKENPEFPAAWRRFQDTFVKALDNPGKWQKATDYVSFGFDTNAPFPKMLMRLPSGRSVVMPYPEKAPQTMIQVQHLTPDTGKVVKSEWEAIPGHFEDKDALEDHLQMGDAFLRPNQRLGKWFQTWDLSFWGHIKGVNYGRVKTYGGDLLQSATQGTGADILASGVLEAERQGFDPFFLVHDQCLTPDNGRKEDFVKAMCKVPYWFKGFMLSADAEVERSYCKS